MPCRPSLAVNVINQTAPWLGYELGYTKPSAIVAFRMWHFSLCQHWHNPKLALGIVLSVFVVFRGTALAKPLLFKLPPKSDQVMPAIAELINADQT